MEHLVFENILPALNTRSWYLINFSSNHCELVSVNIKQSRQLDGMQRTLSATLPACLRLAVDKFAADYSMAGPTRTVNDAFKLLTCEDNPHVDFAGSSLDAKPNFSNIISLILFTPTGHS